MKHSNHLKIKISVLLISALFLSGCLMQRSTPVTRSGFFFDTLVNITVYDGPKESAADECIKMCEYYDSLLSMTVSGSDIGRINAAGTEPVKVSPETIELLEYAVDCYQRTNGAFDISVAPLDIIWSAARENKIPPDETAISEALSRVGLDGLKIDKEGSFVQKEDPSLMLDVGALGKGYVADRLKILLKERGVSSAVISLGGNILTIGSRPDKKPFRIGIKKPFSDSGEISATLNVSDLSVVTSGVYERCFIYNDRIYHHILDTGTGYPADTDLLGATIISTSSLDGDALSTECILLGLDEAMKMIDETPGVAAVFISSDHSLHYSGGAAKYIK